MFSCWTVRDEDRQRWVIIHLDNMNLFRKIFLYLRLFSSFPVKPENVVVIKTPYDLVDCDFDNCGNWNCNQHPKNSCRLSSDHDNKEYCHRVYVGRLRKNQWL